MKRFLLFIFLAALVYPCMSQIVNHGRDKKHTSGTALFKNLTEKKKPEKKELRFDFYDVGVMAMRNNAHADSMLAYINYDKSEMWELYSKEIPVYYDGTNLIKELEVWYTDLWKKEFSPGMKMVAEYDEKGRMIRMETHHWEDDKWVPAYAEEMLIDHLGQEVFFADYYYSEDDEEWVMSYGYRANDEYDENDLLVRRIWEYYYGNGWKNDWYPSWMEEFSYNENDVLYEIIEYYYDDWDEIWEYDYRLTYTVGDDHTWISGYSYYWNWDEEDWVPSLKYVDIEWFNFEFIQFATITILANADEFDDWDDWKDNGDDDITWIKYMRNTAEYTATGLIKSMMIEFWDTEFKEEWTPVFLWEIDYDHFENVIYDVSSAHDGMDWVIMYGQKVHMEYNDDLSIKSFVMSYIDDYWKGGFLPFMMYEFYYSEEPTGLPVVALPEPLVIYPNPASSDLNIQWTGADESIDITIIAVDGKIIRLYENYPARAGETLTLDVSQLKNGIYFIRTQGKTSSRVGRFLKK